MQPGDVEATFADVDSLHEAVGSRRYKVTYAARGGHSWNHFPSPSAIHILARAVAAHWAARDRVLLFAPDHGAHLVSETGRGDHGIGISPTSLGTL